MLPGPKFLALLNVKQIIVLTVAEQSARVFHRLAEKLGGHIARLPWILHFKIVLVLQFTSEI